MGDFWSEILNKINRLFVPAIRIEYEYKIRNTNNVPIIPHWYAIRVAYEYKIIGTQYA